MPDPGDPELGGDARGCRQPRARVRAAAQARPVRAARGGRGAQCAQFFSGTAARMEQATEQANVSGDGATSRDTSAPRSSRANLRGNLRCMLAHLDEKIEVTNAYVTAERVMEIAARGGFVEPEHAKARFVSNRRRSRTRRLRKPRGRSSRRWRGAWWWSRRGSSGTRRLAGGMLGRAVGRLQSVVFESVVSQRTESRRTQSRKPK